MEDYEAAFLGRIMDVEALDKNGRRIATMHFGGIAIECLLKHMIFTSLPKGAKREWKTDTNNPGHTVTNPGHNYQRALRCHHRLWDRVQRSPVALKWLNEVENPGNHFIEIRYSGNEPDDEHYRQWLKAYQSLRGWLQKQATTL